MDFFFHCMVVLSTHCKDTFICKHYYKSTFFIQLYESPLIEIMLSTQNSGCCKMRQLIENISTII